MNQLSLEMERAKTTFDSLCPSASELKERDDIPLLQEGKM
jgi:hypothetical protein